MSHAANPSRMTRLFVPDRAEPQYVRVIGVLLLAGLTLSGTIWLTIALPQVTLATGLLLMLLEVVLVAALSNLMVAILAALAAVLLANWYLVPPTRTWLVASTDDLIVLVVFVVSAVLSSVTVSLAIRKRAEAQRTGMEAETLRETLTEPSADPIAVLAQMSRIFSFTELRLADHLDTTVARYSSRANGSDDLVVDEPPRIDIQVIPGYTLQGWGPEVIGTDQSSFHSLAIAAVRAHEAKRTELEAARASELEAADRARSALLAAVGHDLRTPIAAISVSAAALKADQGLASEDTETLVATIGDSARRLEELVANLLDMSRLEAGQLIAHVSPISVDGAVARACLAQGSAQVRVDIAEGMPLALADDGLLERVLANLLSNAVRHSPAAVEVQCTEGRHGEAVEIAVRDHGPGLSQARLETLFQPFASSGDSGGNGLGVGLAIARGFCDAMGATLTPRPTPGGGLTMVVGLKEVP